MSHPAGSPIITCLRYRDAAAAIDWLCTNFGFVRKMVVPNPDGTIAHAELTLGGGMIMLGSSANAESPYSRLFKQPDEVGGFNTQAAYVVVPDADAIYTRAKSAGPRILLEITDQDYGGRDFTCEDPEGHVWTFGTYDPWSASE